MDSARTRLKRAEAALRESEEKWNAVFENIPTMYFMVDAAGIIVSVNPYGAEQLGYGVDELVGRPVQGIFHEADREAVQKNAAICFQQLGKTLTWELRKVRKTGELIWVREMARSTVIKGRPVLLIICEDITGGKHAAEALRKVQAELAHANRVAALGQLMASITHEIRQPITSVLSNGYAVRNWLDRGEFDEALRTIDCIIKDGMRAGDIISGLHALVKKTPTLMERFDVNAAIREVIVISRSEAVKDMVSVELQLADGLPLVQADRVQLQQVILNLIMNAMEAMLGASVMPRKLHVETAKVGPDSISISVKDSGPGLDPENPSRAFEAFYTTKPDGLGIGLSICRSIVEAHDGTLTAVANVPRGTIFQVTVPIHPPADSS